MLEAERASHSAIALAVRAIAESNAGRYDIAESWYLHAIEAAQSPVLRAEIAHRYGLDLARQGRRDGIDLLERYVGEDLPVELDASLRSTLATAYVLAERYDDARKMMATALTLIDADSSKQLQAKVHHHAAWVALFTAQIAEAKSYATKAVELALECGLYDVAARSYSVLYNVVYDVEDDPQAALEILDRILDCGLKSGIVSVRLFALLGAIDIRAELGDAKGIWRIEKMLAAHGIDYSSAATSAALLPAEALTLAGRGKFAEAYLLIFPTGERQPTADRRAVRFSEIALYAAAGGLSSEATAALKEVEDCLRGCDPAARRSIRTQLNRALALRLLGKGNEAYAILKYVESVHSTMSTRLRALYRVILAIFAHWDGVDNYNDIYNTLHLLREENFGGIAAALASLPCGQERLQIA